DERPALWGFELEYTDEPTRAHLETFYATLQHVLPASIAHELRWLTRSTAQAQLAASLRAAGSTIPTLDYAQLATPGESEVYSLGARIGRLRLLDAKRSTIDQAADYEILVAPAPLDDLPPAAGLVSLVPLTPLSHFNVLARQRGIPCAYLGGATGDPFFATLLKAEAPVLLDARADGVWIAALSQSEFQELVQRPRAAPPAIEPPDVSRMPYVRSLDELARSPASASLQEIGGKMQGFVALAQLAAEDRPDPVAAITVRAYAEHVAALLPTLRQLLADTSFQHNARLRLLALEGPKVFAHDYPRASDAQWAKSIARTEGVVGHVVKVGGVQAMIRARPIEPHTLAQIERELGSILQGVSRKQGLRFRSSSTIEDIEGFNGAGLYDSSTGFFDKQGKNSVESAIKRTWASYWTYRAFEERRRSGIDALGGRMAVVVHPRFDDALELANAVVTYTLFPATDPRVARMDVNAQLGALSVTNPPVDKPNALPEVSQVLLSHGAAAATITRIRASTETPAGSAVFSDDELRSMLAKLRPLAERWLERQNGGVDPTMRTRMATLDLELRRMAPAWPASNGESARAQPRWVVKQMRSLEPPSPLGPMELLELPIPHDVLARSVKLTRVTCERGDLELDLIEAYTAPGLDPDPGYSRTPFIASLTLQDADRALMLTHLDFAGAPDAQHIDLLPGAAAKLGAPRVDLTGMRCEEHVEAAAASELLRDIQKRERPIGRVR
ncbi:MAG TPA: PEP/pyruvate-binding domain-containing protein, partial [Polyangiales bacterium]|nr:PEP/pyruvate-binding domain-containing protein [Polyangiales bacterium]